MDIYENSIKVTIICYTYNQEKYIRQCLDGLVMQQTDFAFEVIVHDDASTDSTADIIREYENKYPEIIRPYYQKENVFSRNIPIEKTFLASMIRGKYIAFCEGDDYWFDIHKLEKQVNIMESQPDCHFCVHRVKNIREDGSGIGTFYPQVPLQQKIISPQDLIKHALEYDFHTTSYFIRVSDYISYIQNPPIYRLVSPVGDTPLMLYCATLGNAYYLDETMTCYRNSSVGSWSRRIADSKEKQIELWNKRIILYQEYDYCTNGQFKDLLSTYILNAKFRLDRIQEDWLACCSAKYTSLIVNHTYRYGLRIWIHAFFQLFNQMLAITKLKMAKI